MEISKEALNELYYGQGMSTREIGEIFGCDRKNIEYYMNKYGIERRSISEAHLLKNEKVRGFKIRIEDIIKMIDDGMLVKEIAEHYGVSRRIIGSLLMDNNIDMRNSDNQRKRQSDFMKNQNPNPKGSKRPIEEMEGSIRARQKIFEIRKNSIKDYKEYQKIARYIAYKYYEKGKLIPDGLVIDHIFSVIDGFNNNVHVDVISHPFNLRLITNEENLKKADKSLITLDELYNGVGAQRPSFME